jgi:hypothetical protein
MRGLGGLAPQQHEDTLTLEDTLWHKLTCIGPHGSDRAVLEGFHAKVKTNNPYEPSHDSRGVFWSECSYHAGRFLPLMVYSSLVTTPVTVRLNCQVR